VLIVAQIGASFMLLIAAGLMLRSLMKIQNLDPGFRTDHRLTFRADMAFDKFPLTLTRAERRSRIAAYWTDFESRLRTIPGVSRIGAGATFPLNERDPLPLGLVREFHPPPPGVQPPLVGANAASPEYFSALDQPLLSGRVFAPSDSFTAPSVAVISESAARQFWPNENPVGTRFVGDQNAAGGTTYTTIVGVVADVRQQLDRTPAAQIYVPLQQIPFTATSWVIETDRPVEQLEPLIRNAAHSLDQTLPVGNFRTLAEVRAVGLTPRRVIVSLIGLFGLLALVITAVGIGGVVAFSVNQRTHEFGIRMALGAQRNGVLGLVLREGLRLVALGLAIGVAGALALTRVLGTVFVATQASSLPLLVDVPPTDVMTYVGVAVVLLLVAVVACVMPARRAASVDPMIALRAP
jgi:putative ABC transport system permease protein